MPSCKELMLNEKFFFKFFANELIFVVSLRHVFLNNDYEK